MRAVLHRFPRLAHLPCYVLAWVVIALWGENAFAMPEVLVLVIAKGTADPAPYELRLRSELRAEGLEALLINAPTQEVEHRALAARFGASGVIQVVLGEGEAEATVWVGEPAQPPEITRSIQVPLEDREGVGVLALRAVNLYVGARLEFEQQRRLREEAAVLSQGPTVVQPTPIEPPKAVPTSPKPQNEAQKNSTESQLQPVPAKAETNPPSAPGDKRFVERLRLAGGVALMQFSDRLERRVAPFVELVVPATRRWLFGMSLTGPYLATLFVNSPATTGDVVETSKITVDQEFLWFDGRYRLTLSEQFDLETGVGMGVARYAVSGESQETFVGRDDHRFSALSNLAIALAWRVAPRVSLLAGVDGILRWQTPKVVVAGRDLSGTSRLNLWAYFGPAWVF